ncbi:hypothetical protein GOBAR_DD31401 [Gossypium barbadense]|nr:hypothetical protein GOBAR_DD31401 [Gossypium barbadense]
MLELSSTLSSHVRFLLQSLTEANADSVFRELCQVLGATDYYCPTFKVKFNFELSDSEKWQPKNNGNKKGYEQFDMVLTAFLQRILDTNKLVQGAACSALAILEEVEAAEKLAPIKLGMCFLVAGACYEQQKNQLPFFPILPENLGTARLVVDFDRWWTGEESVNVLFESTCQVTTVKSARQVIDALNAEGPNIDIILTKVDLPMTKGMKLLKYIMRNNELRRIPVIMMSAQDEVSIVVKCLRLGAADYLVKPLRTNELLNLWTHMWRRRREVCCPSFFFPLFFYNKN